LEQFIKMKIKDFEKSEIKEDQSFFDLSMNIRQDPTEDEHVQQHGEDGKKPVITLRHINKLKRMKAAERKEHDSRKKLLNLMYAIPTETEE